MGTPMSMTLPMGSTISPAGSLKTRAAIHPRGRSVLEEEVESAGLQLKVSSSHF